MHHMERLSLDAAAGKKATMAYGDKCSSEFEHFKSAGAWKQNTELWLAASSRFQVFIS